MECHFVVKLPIFVKMAPSSPANPGVVNFDTMIGYFFQGSKVNGIISLFSLSTIYDAQMPWLLT